MSGLLIAGGCVLIIGAVFLGIIALVLWLIYGRKKVAANATDPVPSVATDAREPYPASARIDVPAAVPVDSDATMVVGLPGYRLVWLTGPLAGQSFALTTRGSWIGRDATADVVVAKPSISKRHLWVGLRNGVPWIEDQSTNGTFYGTPSGERVKEREVTPGDIVIVADDAARFRVEAL